MSGRILLDNLHNTRDLGGMCTADGRKIKSGCLVRSGHLFGASEHDKNVLAGLAEVIVDFRTPGECKEKPNPELPGVAYFHIPIMDSLTAGVTREKEADQKVVTRLGQDPEAARNYMCDMYRHFVSDPFAVSQYRQFTEMLLTHREKAILWHCTAGKDRCGVISAHILSALGVDEKTIMSDYMKSNDSCIPEANEVFRRMRDEGTDESTAKGVWNAFIAKEEYLQSALAVMSFKEDTSVVDAIDESLHAAK